MKLSHKIEYACRVMAQLARSHAGGQLSHIEALAASESIPANYLVQILNELRNAGLIQSRRGKQGGYALARAPESIPLVEIVRAVDSEFLEMNLQKEGASGARVAEIWGDVHDAMERQMETYNLADFVAGEQGEMYYI